MVYTKCLVCQQPFTDKNTHSKDGWMETQISGYCEDCFDELFAEEDSEFITSEAQ